MTVRRKRPRTPMERFWAKFERDANGCWLWTARIDRDGYGIFNIDHRPVRAHRWAYSALVEPIRAGLQIDHLCRVRNCVNPAHLEPVTARENAMRGETLQAANAAKTHCDAGHPFDDENTYIHNGRRHCRECRRTTWREAYDRKRRNAAA